MSVTVVESASAALRRLHEEATPEPWRSLRDGNQYVDSRYFPTAKLVGASRIEGVARPWNPHALIARGFTPVEYETVRFVDGDADLVAILRNALPALADLVEGVEKIEAGPCHWGPVHTKGDDESCPPCIAGRALANLRAKLEGT